MQILSVTGGQKEEDIDDRGMFHEVFLKGMELELDPQRWENLIRKSKEEVITRREINVNKDQEAEMSCVCLQHNKVAAP